MGTVILSGWKAIAQYLDSGIRIVPRWEQQGLPEHRPIPGRRSHVVSRSEEIDTTPCNGAACCRQASICCSISSIREESKGKRIETNRDLSSEPAAKWATHRADHVRSRNVSNLDPGRPRYKLRPRLSNHSIPRRC